VSAFSPSHARDGDLQLADLEGSQNPLESDSSHAFPSVAAIPLEEEEEKEEIAPPPDQPRPTEEEEEAPSPPPLTTEEDVSDLPLSTPKESAGAADAEENEEEDAKHVPMELEDYLPPGAEGAQQRSDGSITVELGDREFELGDGAVLALPSTVAEIKALLTKKCSESADWREAVRDVAARLQADQ
jgi:hypothetical protein